MLNPLANRCYSARGRSYKLLSAATEWDFLIIGVPDDDVGSVNYDQKSYPALAETRGRDVVRGKRFGIDDRYW